MFAFNARTPGDFSLQRIQSVRLTLLRRDVGGTNSKRGILLSVFNHTVRSASKKLTPSLFVRVINLETTSVLRCLQKPLPCRVCGGATRYDLAIRDFQRTPEYGTE